MDPRHGAKVIPPLVDPAPIAAGAFELLAGPEDRPLGAAVETLGIEHGALVVIAQEAELATVDHQIEALAGVRAVAHHVAQTEDLFDLLIADVRKHGPQGFEVAVDVADDRALHRRVDPMVEGCRALSPSLEGRG